MSHWQCNDRMNWNYFIFFLYSCDVRLIGIDELVFLIYFLYFLGRVLAGQSVIFTTHHSFFFPSIFWRANLPLNGVGYIVQPTFLGGSTHPASSHLRRVEKGLGLLTHIATATNNLSSFISKKDIPPFIL